MPSEKSAAARHPRPIPLQQEARRVGTIQTLVAGGAGEGRKRIARSSVGALTHPYQPHAHTHLSFRPSQATILRRRRSRRPRAWPGDLPVSRDQHQGGEGLRTAGQHSLLPRSFAKCRPTGTSGAAHALCIPRRGRQRPRHAHGARQSPPLLLLFLPLPFLLLLIIPCLGCLSPTNDRIGHCRV